jgi:hypothetical protein
MEMETEDDVEGDMHVSSTGAARIVTDDEFQQAVDDNIEMTVPEKELAALQ